MDTFVQSSIQNYQSTMYLSSHSHQSFFRRCKLGVLSLMIVVFVIYRFGFKSSNPVCLRDRWHNFTERINRALKNGYDDVFIGIGQILIDGWLTGLVVFWLVNYNNLRPIWSFGMFFAIRAVFLNIQAMPFPNKIVWHSPGFFSLAVPYDHTRDFYYSGHTGTIAIFFIQSFRLPHRALTLFLFISLTYMVLMLTITRVHYTTDIIGGLIFSLFCYKIGTITIYYFDWIFSSPFYIASKIRQKVKRFAKNQIELDKVIYMIENTDMKHIPLQEEF